MSANIDHLCGWIDSPKDVEHVLATLPRPVFGSAAQTIVGSGKGKTALLYQAVEKVVGNFPVYPAQEIGDCVSHGYRTCVDVLKCVEIAINLESEQWTAETATEPIYGGSRVEVGGGKIRGDGSVGAWAAKWISEWGVLSRLKYGDVDLTAYSGSRAKQWGNRGVPDELESVAREHPVKTVSLVQTYNEARDAIANGYPVAVCSNQGFAMTRDSEGFAKAKGSWAHCMAFIAADDEYRRPGLLCMNSWGPDWISGPKRHGQPDGSFWVDADVADRMLRGGDSFALSAFDGYPSQELDWMLV
jgi:hypothetical protein